MKSMACLAALLGVVATLAFPTAASAQNGTIEQALLQLERDWEQANAKNDSAALDRLLAPEFVNTDSDGRLFTRAEVMTRRKSGAVKFTTFTQDDYKVHVLGNTAVVTGRSTTKQIRDGRDYSGRERFTDVFVRRDGRWQAVSTHSSRIITP